MGRSARTLRVAVSLGALLALLAVPARGDTTLNGSARLQGQFVMAGRITSVTGVRGERRGQRVKRTWTFSSPCPTGACARVGLDRQRSGGTDHVTLHRRSPGAYSGTGRFYVPLRCGGRTYARGESVPFSVTVKITGAVLSSGIPVATQVSATYTSRSRTNLTPCVRAPAHETATYRGTLTPPAG